MLYTIFNLINTYLGYRKSITAAPSRRHKRKLAPENAENSVTLNETSPETAQNGDGTAFQYKVDAQEERVAKVEKYTEEYDAVSNDDTKMDETNSALDQTTVLDSAEQSMDISAEIEPLESSETVKPISFIPEQFDSADDLPIPSKNQLEKHKSEEIQRIPYNFRKRSPVSYVAEKRHASADKPRNSKRNFTRNVKLSTPLVVKKQKKQSSIEN
jgi:hypothetical protein